MLLLVWCGLLLAVVGGARANAIGAGSPDTEQGLYNASDLVFVLDDTNFKASVYASSKAWLVEFYNSWCGFCRKFAPVWKSLAKSVHGWEDIVMIAAIDCANDENNPLCREYEVMRYPTLKFFPVNSNKDFLGLEVQKDNDEILIKQELINQLVKEQQEQRGGSNWPNIVPYRGSELETLWHGAPSKIRYEFLIFEEPKSYLGAEVILDLHKLDTIRVRSVTSENELLCVTSKVTKFPSLIVLARDNSQTFLKIETSTREGIRNAITEFLKSKDISVDIKEDSVIETPEHSSNQLALKAKNETRKPNNSADKLYQLDLESTLRYSLNNEIPLSATISGEKLEALKKYLNVLSKYFPVYLPKMKTYLQVLKEVVESKNSITGKEFKKHVKVKEEGLAPVFSAPKTWVGCKGSQAIFRGYPCGLWTMFHTLTIAAAEEEVDSDVYDEDHPSVLAAMHGYIKNFFGCADCSDHFQSMAHNRSLFEVRGGDNSIIWLWRAHNEVNKRLAGDETEDPEHKKVQYPTLENCPKCKFPDERWDEDEVLRYLKTKYSKFNIDSEGISDQLRQHDIASSVANSGSSHRKFSWDFTIFDISICVVLYVASAAILTLVCIKFAYKRTHKKKVSYPNLFSVNMK